MSLHAVPSQPSPADELLSELTGRPANVLHGTWLIISAHPDDETIGASWLLQHVRDPLLVHVTDGAPRDPALWSPRAPLLREDYAAVRKQELRSAIDALGASRAKLVHFELTDQEASHSLLPLVLRIEVLLAEVRPVAVVTHPYEGGHPDHDACAFAVQLASQRCMRARPPILLEMSSYHRWNGVLRTGAFLPGGREELSRALTPEERSRKQRALRCFDTQRDVLQQFSTEVEKFRLAPRYDFSRPPHEGALHYETLGWRLSGAQWRASASRALRLLSSRAGVAT